MSDHNSNSYLLLISFIALIALMSLYTFGEVNAVDVPLQIGRICKIFVTFGALHLGLLVHARLVHALDVSLHIRGI